ncbi:MAG: hypothetical protein ACPGOY_07750 [Rhodospirillaceae bacterium]
MASTAFWTSAGNAQQADPDQPNVLPTEPAAPVIDPTALRNGLAQAARYVQIGRPDDAYQVLLPLAEAGSVPAMRTLALIDVLPAGTSRKAARAVPWLRKAHAQGDPIATVLLARELAAGQGANPDLATAQTLANAAGRSQDPLARSLAAALWAGWGEAGSVPPRQAFETALQILNSVGDDQVNATDRGVLLWRYQRALQDSGLGAADGLALTPAIKQDFGAGAASQDPVALAALALILAAEGSAQDALVLLDQTSARHHPRVLAARGWIQVRHGGQQAVLSGLKLLSDLAQTGDLDAAVYLAKLATQGQPGAFPPDEALARRWFDHLADRQDPRGTLGLARLELRDNPDLGKALLQNAARNGEREAMDDLAALLSTDHLGLGDRQLAVLWQDRAALPALGLLRVPPLAPAGQWAMPGAPQPGDFLSRTLSPVFSPGTDPSAR